MKILFLIDAINTGGKERRMIELLKGLIKTGNYEITLISFTPGVEYPYLLEMPLEFIEFKRVTKKDFSIFSKLYKVIKRFKPDIIHSWGNMASFYLLPSLAFYKPVIFINGIISDAPKNLSLTNKHYLLSFLTFPFSDAIIANSIAGIKSYNPRGNKTYCIYNGMDFNRFKNLKPKKDLLDSLGLTGDEFLAGMVAAFEDRKDHETIIRAAAKIQPLNKNIKFLLLGDGSLLNSMKDLAESLGAKNILFLGRLTDVENYIQLMNVGVLTSTIHGEGIANALIESMALGKPIIGTDGGGTNELIVEGENGYLIPTKSPDKLVEKILYLYDHKEVAEKMGENGQKMAQAKFKLDRMTTDYIKLYDDLMHNRKTEPYQLSK